MKIRNLAAVVVGVLVLLQAGVRAPRPTRRTRQVRDERGLSQSAETAILLAGAVVVAGIVVTVITAFVKSKLPK
ncbi:hypothetical protein [Microlunatus flavus]|uniref:Uncharacterized protein n=1 Tax=Microlunatus flavus TaxID=1036181 RepID=A0A1H9B494_9ACTN|nr:hypothetical protein [Microlunatus flavus]SEP83541.1 hypothetical protein SAMN05421756_101829 [Microlunatus flavus]